MNQDKYDRQIRLWGVDGQKAIEGSVVVCFGSDEISSEILKNLVLHAFGEIIIVDDHVVTEEDIGINFFLEAESVGKQRANEVARLLSEMNPDPKITAIIKGISNYEVLDEIDKEKVFVISHGNLTKAEISKLSDKIREKNFKQLHIQTTGFFGAFYLDAGSHHSFDGVDHIKHDLRINRPFPELEEFFKSYDIFDKEKVDDLLHSQLPFPVFLYYARQRVFAAHPGETKLNSRYISELIKQVKTMYRTQDQENVDEAKYNVPLAIDSEDLPITVQRIFSLEPESIQQEDHFWRLVHASHEFYNKHGIIPLCGKIPDMESSSAIFNKLKAIFKNKSAQDIEDIASLVPDIDKSEVERFVKSIGSLTAYNYPPIKESIERVGDLSYEYEKENLYKNITRNLFVASRAFKEKTGKDPVLADKDKFIECLRELGTPEGDGDLEKFAAEFVRFNGQILPSVAASLAAIAAQEITKVIIMKATPCKPIVAYDAIHGQIYDGE